MSGVVTLLPFFGLIYVGLENRGRKIMLKKFVFSLIVLVFGMSMHALSYSDLATSAKENVKTVVEANVDDVEYITVEELEGVKFEICVVTDDYVIIEVDGVIYIVSKD